jgi:hypothetical protein
LFEMLIRTKHLEKGRLKNAGDVLLVFTITS